MFLGIGILNLGWRCILLTLFGKREDKESDFFPSSIVLFSLVDERISFRDVLVKVLLVVGQYREENACIRG